MGKGSSIATRCGVGCRCGLDPELLGLWCRSAATALIRPLAWEPPYAISMALKRQKDTTTKKKKEFSHPGKFLCCALGDPALPQLQCRLQLQHEFDPWPRELPHAMGVTKKCV